MKRILLLLVLVIPCLSQLTAQTVVPNAGFENWSTFTTGTSSYEVPNQWRTSDTITVANSTGLFHSASKEAVLVHSGTYSLNLRSWSYYIASIPFINGIPGCATNGDVIINTAAATITPIGGSPDTVLHAQLNGYYQYTAGGSGADSASVEVCYFKRNTSTGNRDTAAWGKNYFHNQVGYTLFSVDILPYGTPVMPDSVLIWIQSSPRTPLGSGQTGSVMLVDSLYFSGILGVNSVPAVLNSIHVYPVPASDELTVELDLKNTERTSFQIIDITGKNMLTHEMNSSKEKINISILSNGNYFYHLLDKQGNRLGSGKFTVNK